MGLLSPNPLRPVLAKMPVSWGRLQAWRGRCLACPAYPTAKERSPCSTVPDVPLDVARGIVLCGDPHAARVQMWPWTENMLRWPEACSACVAAYQHPKSEIQVDMPPLDLTLKKTPLGGIRSVRKRACGDGTPTSPTGG